jgi:hypothetical protein
MIVLKIAKVEMLTNSAVSTKVEGMIVLASFPFKLIAIFASTPSNASKPFS